MKTFILSLFFLLTAGYLCSKPVAQTQAPWEAASYEPNQNFPWSDSTDWYKQNLRTALRRVIPWTPENDQVDRVMRLAADGPESFAELIQILSAHRVKTLADFSEELLGRIDGKRKQLSRLEEEILRLDKQDIPLDDQRERVSLLLAQIDHERQEVRASRLTPEEAAVLLHFYQRISSEENLLITAHPISYEHTLVARQFATVIQLPPIQLRTHGQHHPPVPFHFDSDGPDWRAVLAPFWHLGLQYEWLQIWSQLVNQTAGAERYRHLEGFEFRFLHELRRFALDGENLFRAKELLLAFLANHNSSVKGIARYGVEPQDWPDSAKRSLGYGIVLLNQMRNREELRRAFSAGEFPRRFSGISSKQWKKVHETFRAAGNMPDRETCIGRLISLFLRPAKH